MNQMARMKISFLASMDKWRTTGHSLIQTDSFITIFFQRIIFLTLFIYVYGSKKQKQKQN